MLRTIDPVRFSDALEGLCSGIFGVLVVLKFQFARTVNLAVSIGNYMRPLAAAFVAPEMGKVTPVEYQQWIMPCINYGCKAIAVSVSWYIQVRSARFSSLKRDRVIAMGNFVLLMIFIFSFTCIMPPAASH